MKSVKFWYTTSYHNNGDWGGSSDSAMGPFTTKNSAKKALKCIIREQAEYWTPKNDHVCEYRFKDRNESLSHDEFVEKFIKHFDTHESLTLVRYDREQQMYDGCSQDIYLYVKDGTVDFAETFDELSKPMNNDVKYKYFDNQRYLKYSKK